MRGVCAPYTPSSPLLSTYRLRVGGEELEVLVAAPNGLARLPAGLGHRHEALQDHLRLLVCVNVGGEVRHGNGLRKRPG